MKTKRLLCLLFAFLMVFGLFTGCAKGEKEKAEFSTFEDFENAKLGILVGSEFDPQTQNLFPENEKFRFDSITDLVANVEMGKIDGFLLDETFYSSIAWERTGFKAITSDKTTPVKYGFITAASAKGTKLRAELNNYIAEINSNGEIEKLAKKWFSGVVPADYVNLTELSGENGTISVACSDSDSPMSFIKDQSVVGFDIDIIIAFAKKHGYKVEFNPVEFDALISGVATAKYDIGVGGTIIMEERKEEFNYTDPYYQSPVVMVTRGIEKGTSRVAELADKKIGMLTGSLFSVTVPKMLPNAAFFEFNNTADMLQALENGKIDSFPTDESIYKAMLWEGANISRIDEAIDVSNYGIIFTKGANPELQKQVNDYIAKTKADGTLAALEAKWFADSEPEDIANYSSFKGENGQLKLGLNSGSKPFVYIKDNKFAGFDIEFLVGFAKEYGYGLDFQDTAFASIMGGIEVGKYDIGISGITITDERRESVDFSDVYHVEDLVFVIKGSEKAEDLSQFNNATLGVVTGSLYGGYSREQFPNANIKEFNNFADVLAALQQGKVTGVMLDKPNFNSVARTDDNLSCITTPAYSVEIGFGFQKNDGGYALQAQMNAFLAKLKADGTTDKLIEKWYGAEEPSENVPLEELASNGKMLNVSIDTTRKPFVYMYEGKPVGFEIEVLYMFCKEHGYNVNISDVSFASGLAGLASEKYDLVCGGLYMTPERKESVNFSEPYMLADVVMAKYERGSLDNFIVSIGESFSKTFVREQRWKLIVEGVFITMVISIFSVLFGTLLGFGLYMLARSKRKWISKTAKKIASVYSAIIAGTPTLVVLMILFYIVFTSPNMSGVVVAIIGFTLTFGAFVYDNLTLTVDGVDKGQTEAAYALGYSRNRTFFRIILPQAMKMFVPGYTGEIVNLVKATSVVGYIAVNDLTKMGDIIRGNTYEAFFPLIAVAVIYFIITWIIASLLGILKNKTEPKKRKNKNILKGVVR